MNLPSPLLFAFLHRLWLFACYGFVLTTSPVRGWTCALFIYYSYTSSLYFTLVFIINSLYYTETRIGRITACPPSPPLTFRCPYPSDSLCQIFGSTQGAVFHSQQPLLIIKYMEGKKAGCKLVNFSASSLMKQSRFLWVLKNNMFNSFCVMWHCITTPDTFLLIRFCGFFLLYYYFYGFFFSATWLQPKASQTLEYQGININVM